MGTSIVVYEPQVAPQYKEANPVNNLHAPSGFLVANNGEVWSITKRAVDVLTADDLKPDIEFSYEDKILPAWNVDKGGERYYKTTGTKTRASVNKCVYDAIRQYVVALSLGTLTSGDQDFFVNHPRVSPEGVNRANVLMVSQGLIWPWGLGIDRVWVPKLSSVGDQQEEFMRSLGVNPIALTDYETSNEDLIELLELDPNSEAAQQIREDYRFEFVDEPGRPSVVMMSSYSKKNTSANVGGVWSNTSYGSGHADFVGPRDKIHGTWEIAFSIKRNPSYAGDVDMSAYSDLGFFDKEIKELKEAEEKAPKDLSTWSSLVHGKSISDRDKEQNPVVQAYKPPYTQQSYNWKKDNKNGKDEVRKKETCPSCGNASIKSYGDYAHCMKCNWWEDLEDTDSLYVCPFCGGEMLQNGMCPDCIFDDEIWRKSQVYSCKKHTDIDVYFSNLGANYERLDAKDFVYACPLCLKEQDLTLDQFYKAGSNHKGDMVTSGKRKGS